VARTTLVPPLRVTADSACRRGYQMFRKRCELIEVARISANSASCGGLLLLAAASAIGRQVHVAVSFAVFAYPLEQPSRQ
jgi:hypothetical protein